MRATITTGVTWLAGALVALVGAYDKVKDSPRHGFFDICGAAFTPVLPLIGSIAAILGFAATAAQLFGPKPATANQLRAYGIVLNRWAERRHEEIKDVVLTEGFESEARDRALAAQIESLQRTMQQVMLLQDKDIDITLSIKVRKNA